MTSGLSAAEVLKDSAGSNNNASASFLIYTDDHAVKLKMVEGKMTPGSCYR